MAKCVSIEKPSIENLLKEGEAFKEEGNTFYKSNQLKKAIRSYHYAILHLKNIGESKDTFMNETFLGSEAGSSCDGPMKERAAKLLCDCYNNLAVCLLKESKPQYEKVKFYSENVLSHESENVKALYRLGVAHYHLRDYDKSLETLLNVQSLNESQNIKDASTTRYIQLCREQIKLNDTKMKKVYQNMFAAAADTRSFIKDDGVKDHITDT